MPLLIQVLLIIVECLIFFYLHTHRSKFNISTILAGLFFVTKILLEYYWEPAFIMLIMNVSNQLEPGLHLEERRIWKLNTSTDSYIIHITLQTIVCLFVCCSTTI